MKERDSLRFRKELEVARYINCTEDLLPEETHHVSEWYKEFDGYVITFKEWQLILFAIGWSVEATFRGDGEAIHLYWQTNTETMSVGEVERFIESAFNFWKSARQKEI